MVTPQPPLLSLLLSPLNSLIALLCVLQARCLTKKTHQALPVTLGTGNTTPGLRGMTLKPTEFGGGFQGPFFGPWGAIAGSPGVTSKLDEFLSFDSVAAARKATRESGRLKSSDSGRGCGATPASMADVKDLADLGSEEDEWGEGNRRLLNDSYVGPLTSLEIFRRRGLIAASLPVK